MSSARVMLEHQQWVPEAPRNDPMAHLTGASGDQAAVGLVSEILGTRCSGSLAGDSRVESTRLSRASSVLGERNAHRRHQGGFDRVSRAVGTRCLCLCTRRGSAGASSGGAVKGVRVQRGLQLLEACLAWTRAGRSDRYVWNVMVDHGDAGQGVAALCSIVRRQGSLP
jgi:hypothetical protein